MTTSLAKKVKRLFEEVMSNEDLLLEVLLRLPAKSLIRFKCVSKRWLSLISDPRFCSKHTRLNPTSSTLGIYFDYNLKNRSGLKSVSLHQANRKDLPTLTFIKNAFPGFHYDLPVHACNGLLLCRYSFNGPYFVCNVVTQTFTLIPQHLLPASGRYHGNHCAYLVFNPSKSPHFKVVLLGLSKGTTDTIIHNDDEYKERTANYNGRCYEIDVYSSEAVVWERKYFRVPHGHGSHIDYKAVCNGSLHWITKKKFHVQFEVDSWKLIFNPLSIKPRTLEVEKIRFFGECCGRLFIIHLLRRCAKSFNVHELDKDQDSWTMKYSVDLRPLMTSFQDNFRFANARNNWNFSIMCVVKEDETNDDALLLTIPGKIISYNLIRNTFKVLHEVPMKEFPLVNGYSFAHTFPLMATLSPI